MGLCEGVGGVQQCGRHGREARGEADSRQAARVQLSSPTDLVLTCMYSGARDPTDEHQLPRAFRRRVATARVHAPHARTHWWPNTRRVITPVSAMSAGRMVSGPGRPFGPASSLGLRLAAPLDLPTAPPHLLLRVHLSDDLLGGWISVRASASQRLGALRRHILAHHVSRRRCFDLRALLDATETPSNEPNPAAANATHATNRVCLARCVAFERDANLNDDVDTDADERQLEPVDEDMTGHCTAAPEDSCRERWLRIRDRHKLTMPAHCIFLTFCVLACSR